MISAALQRTIRALHPLLSLTVPELAAEGSPEGSFDDICTYLELGGDKTTLERLNTPKPDFESYLALLHEHVELGVVRPFLDTQRPPKKQGVFRPPKRDFGARGLHRWHAQINDAGFHQERRRGDQRARLREGQAVQALARLFLGAKVSVQALLWNVEGATKASAAEFTDEQREDFNRLLRTARVGEEQEPDAATLASAKAIRNRVYKLTLAAISNMGSIERLAFALWKMRNEPLWDDQRDWFAADAAWKASEQ